MSDSGGPPSTASSEMVERVAKAIAEAIYGPGAPVMYKERHLARAAIRAMAGPGEGLFTMKLPPLGSAAQGVCEAMIDTALKG